MSPAAARTPDRQIGKAIKKFIADIHKDIKNVNEVHLRRSMQW